MEKLSFHLDRVPPFRLDLASGLNDHRPDLESLPGEGDETAVKSLTSLPGIGRWTAEYFLLRGAGRLHSFPGDGVGERNHLQRWLGMADKLDYERVEQAWVAWKPHALKSGGLYTEGRMI